MKSRNNVLTLFILIMLISATVIFSEESEASTYYSKQPRYYFDENKCPWDEGFPFLAKQLVKIHILDWEAFTNEAWKRRFHASKTMAFQDGWSIFLKEGYTEDNKYHELSHIQEMVWGKTGHDMECWSTEKPFGYDKLVSEKLKMLEGI